MIFSKVLNQSTIQNNENLNSLLSSTPLEMDDNLSRLNQSQTEDEQDDNQDNYSNLNDSASVKQNNHSMDANTTRLNAMIETLTEQLNFKTKQNSDLNNCLIKQTNLCENLSDMLKKSQQKVSLYFIILFYCLSKF